LINKFLSGRSVVEVWGSPDVSRDFIYIDDFVERVLLLFEVFSGFEVFNVASGNIYTIGEVVDLIKELTNFQGEVAYNSNRPTTFTKKVLDISKAESVIGARDITSLKKGLEQTINWFKENCRGLK